MRTRPARNQFFVRAFYALGRVQAAEAEPLKGPELTAALLAAANVVQKGIAIAAELGAVHRFLVYNGSVHVYRIARAAFTALVRTGKSQSILVSGDSGAGKTEACKLVVACLARLAPSGRAGATEAALGGALMLEAREFVGV